MRFLCKISLIGLFFIIFLPTGDAQNMWWGIKGGINFGTPYGKAEEGATGAPGVGPRMGVFVRRHVKNRLDVQLEVLYSVKGASYKTPVSGDTLYEEEIMGKIYLIPTYYSGWVEGKFKNVYLDFPITARYEASRKFFLLFGPQISYLLNGSNKGLADIDIGENYSSVKDEPFDESDQLNRWDYSLLFATSYETPGGLNFELGFSYGLRSIYKDSYDKIDDTYRNIYLQAMVGYRFGKPGPESIMK